MFIIKDYDWSNYFDVVFAILSPGYGVLTSILVDDKSYTRSKVCHNAYAIFPNVCKFVTKGHKLYMCCEGKIIS